MDPVSTRPVPLEVYGLLRAALGLLAAWWLVTVFPCLDLLFTAQGVLPRALAAWYTGGWPGLPWDSSAGALATWGLALLCALLFAVGCWPRVTGVVLYGLILVFLRRNELVTDGAVRLLTSLLFLLLLTPCGARFAWPRRREPPAQHAWRGPLFLMQLQIALVYLYSGFYKLMSADWIHGEAVFTVLGNPQFRHADWWAWWTPGPVTHAVLSVFCIGVIVFELSFPVLIWVRRCRPWVLVAGLGLHVPQWITIGPGFFPALMLASYLVFLDDPAAWQRWKNLVGERLKG